MPDITDLTGLSEPAKLLIEKFSNAVGIVFEPWHITRKAVAEAKAAETKARSDLKILEMSETSIEERASQRLSRQEIRKQQNIENVAALSLQSLPANANPSALEDDWLANLFARCENVSDKHMQQVWARILAREATAPGSFSRRTVNILADLEKEDASDFRRLAQSAWNVEGDTTVLIYDLEREAYSRIGITVDHLLRLQELGLITYEPSSLKGFRFEVSPPRLTASYFGTKVALQLPDDGEMRLGLVALTRTGKELLSICEPSEDEGFRQYILAHWETLGYSPRIIG